MTNQGPDTRPNAHTLRESLREFARERDWEQFHSPKNLVMALSGEVGELTELFQWLTEEASRNLMSEPDRAQRVREELGDVYLYLLRLADELGVDLDEAGAAKMEINRLKYPVELARGRALKSDEL
jgi:NTP pyrophosphatase (non-canonical NTP hydrolase)